MSDHRERADDTGAMAQGDDLEALFAAARAQQPPPLSDRILHRLLADAVAQHPGTVMAQPPAKPSILAVLWQGLQEIFGGRQGVAGVVLASCVAFAFGVLAPDTAGNLIGLTASVELAALDLDADPSVLWAEE